MAAKQFEFPWTPAIQADDIGIKLEMVGGIPTWEAFPTIRHQKAVAKAFNSVRPRVDAGGSDCGCFAYMDIYIQFGENSFKRPDVSIYCSEPAEIDGAVQTLPEAVIEVLSKGYEKKDLEFGVPFYLAQGIRDVLVFEPFDQILTHHTPSGTSTHQAPKTIELACGCIVSF